MKFQLLLTKQCLRSESEADYPEKILRALFVSLN